MDWKGYGLDGPANESRLGEGFSHSSRPILDPIQPHIRGYRVFALGKAEGIGVDHLPPTSTEVKKFRPTPLLPLWGSWPVLV
jgi:hypothetical protein